MIFVSQPIAQCAGAILAHSFKGDAIRLKKGTRLTDEHVAKLTAAGVSQLTVARLDEGDVSEDAAAAAIAKAVAGSAVTVERAFTGRSNLFAENAGVLRIEREAVDALNRIDPAITIATLADSAGVEAGRMVATVKIIPYAVAGALVQRAVDAASGGLVAVAPYGALKVAVISTLLPVLKSRTVDKTVAVTRERLAPAGAEVVSDIRVPHETGALADALTTARDEGAELILAFGASANVDRGDVVPSAIERAGGRVEHFGMPVDPGNLLVLGSLGDVPVMGAPGCARSPRENGFDWVLQRLLAGIPVTSHDLTGMGVGGLLMEIVSRPQPREDAVEPPAPDEAKVAALILAAGRSSRMGGPNKLLATIGGVPLVRIAAINALESAASSVTVVTGHMGEQVAGALDGLDVTIVHNHDYAKGLSSSLKTGIAALGDDIDAALVMLADMPRVASADINRIIAAHNPAAGTLVVVPTVAGKQGNPVLWSRRFFPDLTAIEGDTGARHLIGANREAIVEVEIGEAARLDLDTPQALEAAGGALPDA